MDVAVLVYQVEWVPAARVGIEGEPGFKFGDSLPKGGQLRIEVSHVTPFSLMPRPSLAGPLFVTPSNVEFH